jgi:hypothetical protein
MYFAVAFSFILAGTMDYEGMEEYNVAFFHLQIYSLAFHLLVLLDSEVGFVDLAVPVGVDVVVEWAGVGFGHDVQ